jgi:histidinol-phosphate aminotransferase
MSYYLPSNWPPAADSGAANGRVLLKRNFRMSIRRRNFLKQLTGGAAAGAVFVHDSSDLDGGAWVARGMAASDAPLLLDLNENAYGASPRAVEALRNGLREINRFPAEPEETVRKALAEFHHKPPEKITVAAGSNEILQLAATAYLSPGQNVIVGVPGYGAIDQYARARGADVAAVPLRKDHSHDLEAMLAKADSRTALVYICNPNNPTSTLTDRKEIDAFLGKVPEPVTVIVDEAYHEYAGGPGAYRSLVEQPAERPGVVVLRTFSKAYGLAGLRLGYAFSDQETAARLASGKPRFSVSRLATAAGVAALRDRDYIAECIRRNRNDRQEFINQVNARMLRVLSPHANFACLNVMRPAGEILEHFHKHNVRLGPEIPSMPNYIRVSFGTPEQMRKFWKIWDLQGIHPMAM